MSDAARVLTWAALLSRWTDFAKSAVALPKNREGGKLREAVPALIGLQAVTHALAEIDQLPEGERALGLDRGEVLIRRYGTTLAAIWGGDMAGQIREVVEDAKAALAAARAQWAER